MAGLYDMLKYLDDEGLHHQEIRMLCDNKGCIKVLLNPNPTGLTNLNQYESNITVAIRRLLPKFNNLHLAHVYGHQNDNVPVSEDIKYKSEFHLPMSSHLPIIHPSLTHHSPIINFS